MNRKITFAGEEFDPEDYEGGYSEWEMMMSKPVLDSDGFYTDYTMWYSPYEDKYVFTFGDKDIYYPENSDWDWECEDRDEAAEWFDNYVGPGEEDMDIEDDDIYSAEDAEKLDATDIVRDMYRNFPNIDFIDEFDVVDGVNLVFEHHMDPTSEEFKPIIEKLESYGYDYEYDVPKKHHNKNMSYTIQINGVPD